MEPFFWPPIVPIEEPFWQKLIIALFETSFALVIAGCFAAWITSRAQRHRDREKLATQMVKTAVALYLQTQHHWRNRGREKWDPAPNQPTAASRIALDRQYLKTLRTGEVLEVRLRTLFRDDAPQRHWHAAKDLLTVRYYQVIGIDGKASEGLLLKNAGPDHSGLSVEELRNAATLLDAYRNHLSQASRAVSSRPLFRCARHAGRGGRALPDHDFDPAPD